jgi:hypothetical protein
MTRTTLTAMAVAGFSLLASCSDPPPAKAAGNYLPWIAEIGKSSRKSDFIHRMADYERLVEEMPAAVLHDVFRHLPRTDEVIGYPEDCREYLIARMVKEDDRAAFEFGLTVPDAEEQEWICVAAYQSAAERDQQAAVELLGLLKDGKHPNVSRAVHAEHQSKVAKDDPEVALKWIQDGVYEGPVVTVFFALAKRGDIENLRDIALGLDGRDRDDALWAVFYSWARKDAEAANTSFATITMEDPNRQEKLWNEVLTQLAKTDTRKAIGLAEQRIHSDEEKGSFFGKTLGAWARTDADAARAWFESLPEGDAKQKAFETAMIYLADHNNRLALELLKQRGADPVLEQILDGQIGRLVERDLSYALEWIKGVTDPKVRKAALPCIAQHYARDDHAKALEWVLNLPDEEGKKLSCWRVITSGPDERLPQSLAWAKSLSPEKYRTTALQASGLQYSYQDARRALQWAESMIDDPAGDAIIDTVTTITCDELPEESLKLALRSKSKERDEALYHIADTWLNVDPDTAMKKLPTSGIPASVQKELLEGRQGSDD